MRTAQTVTLSVRRRLTAVPALEAHLGKGLEAWLPDAVAQLSAGAFPLPPTCRTFEGPFFRPVGHARSFYYRPEGATGVIAFKGLEPLCADYETLVTALQHSPVPENLITTQRRWAEHFVLRESTVPGAFTLTEADEEFEKAARLQERHLAVYGEPARLPFPLAVVAFSPQQGAALIDVVRRHLSPVACEAAEAIAKEGFGAYAYYYGGPPTRASELDRLLGGGGFEVRYAALTAQHAPQAVIDRWVQLLVRIMYLGYLPASLAAFGTGNMVGGQNAVVDGGFVDLDSLVAIAELKDDTFFYDALHFTLWGSFFRTVHTFLVRNRLMPDDAPGKFVLDYLYGRIRAALTAEARPGATLDPRIREYFAPSEGFDALLDKLKRYHRGDAQTLTLNVPFPQPPPKPDRRT